MLIDDMLRKSIFVSFFLLPFLASGLTFAQEEKGVPETPNNLRISTRYDGATAVAELLWQDHSDNEVGLRFFAPTTARSSEWWRWWERIPPITTTKSGGTLPEDSPIRSEPLTRRGEAKTPMSSRFGCRFSPKRYL